VKKTSQLLHSEVTAKLLRKASVCRRTQKASDPDCTFLKKKTRREQQIQVARLRSEPARNR